MPDDEMIVISLTNLAVLKLGCLVIGLAGFGGLVAGYWMAAAALIGK